MALPRAYKTDESFLEKIAIGATGTRYVLDDLSAHKHEPIELERGSTSFKIWKAIKIKRVRVPDILCLRCGRRVESRAKTKVEISMSHSVANAERGWDFGLHDVDLIAIVRVQRSGEGPLDWSATAPVQYMQVSDMRAAWRRHLAVEQRPKGAQEGFEIRVVWPSATAKTAGRVEVVSETGIAYRVEGASRPKRVRFGLPTRPLRPLVAVGEDVLEGQILASVVPVATEWPCEGGATIDTYLSLVRSKSLADRYSATKALGHFPGEAATDALADRVQDEAEHIYVRAEAAAGLARREEALGTEVLRATLHNDYLENRLEAAIILGEVRTPTATDLLVETLRDEAQHPEIRAGAAWSLGEIQAPGTLPVLVESFAALDPIIRIEAARAIAKLARTVRDDVISVFPEGTPEQRTGIAWALSRAGGFTVSDLLPTLVDEDARQWVAYMIGTQDREEMLPQIERLAEKDSEVYFAVTVLWKIFASWVHGLEEY